MIKVMKFWLDMGVDGFRADAVPYLFEREGTNCENLPETHVYLKAPAQLHGRSTIRGASCSARQTSGRKMSVPYFGDGDEFHMGFHFPVMPRIFMALPEKTAPPGRGYSRTPPISLRTASGAPSCAITMS
jgi:maltose alpha-D-glucosyltransferase / alpha-amylase